MQGGRPKSSYNTFTDEETGERELPIMQSHYSIRSGSPRPFSPIGGSPRIGRMKRSNSFPPHAQDYNALPGFFGSLAEDVEKAVGDLHGGGPLLKAGGMTAAVYTLCSISLGVGVFVLPVVLRSMGSISGSLCLFFFGLWSYWMQIILMQAAYLTTPVSPSYEDLADRAFGVLGKFTLAFFTAFTLLIGNAAHMKTIVVLLHDIMEWYITGEYGQIPYNTNKRLILYVGLFSIAIIFCTGERISSLRYASTASVSVVLLTCMWCTFECMFWYWPHGDHAFVGAHRAPLISGDWKEYAADLPAIAFAFTSAFCIFPVAHELEDRSLKNVNRSVYISTWVCTIGYFLVSIIGVLTFGTRITTDPETGGDASNYLFVFPPSHYVVSFFCFLLVVVITLLYAVINFPVLNAIEKIVELTPVPACMDYRQSFLEWRHHRLFLSLAGMVFIVFLNFQFTSLVSLFGLCGGWGVGFVGYVIPSAIYLKLCPNEPLYKRCAAYLSILAMLVIVWAYTYVTFIM